MKTYVEGLTAMQTASAIQAARLNAIDLVETAELLFTLKRYAHSMALSILAIEEAGKLPILLGIYLNPSSDQKARWRSFRSHTAKTKTLGPGLSRESELSCRRYRATSRRRSGVADRPQRPRGQQVESAVLGLLGIASRVRLSSTQTCGLARSSMGAVV